MARRGCQDSNANSIGSTAARSSIYPVVGKGGHSGPPLPNVASSPDDELGVQHLPRFEDDLLAVVQLVLEDLVAARRLVEAHRVGDHEARVDLTALDPLQ